MINPKFVMLDCDGVLVDSEPATNQVLSDNLTGYGFPVSQEDCIRLFVGGTLAGVGDYVRDQGVALPDHWVDEIYEQAFEALSKGVPLFPGVVEFLDMLDARGIGYCIISNGPLPKMKITLGPSGLIDRFGDRIYSAHDPGPAKPEPGMLIRAAKDAGVSTSDCIMVDDSANGLMAANAASVHAIAFIVDGHPTPKVPFDTLVNGFDALANLIE